MKIYQLVECIDEGVMNTWLFRAESEWHVAKYITDNYWNYYDLFKELGLDAHSHYEEEEPITPEVLLNAISESHVDGDSSSGFEIFETTDEEIIPTNNADLVPSEDYKIYLNHFTGHKNFPYKTFMPFHQVDGYVLKKLANFKWHRFEKENEYQGFADWLAKVPESEITESELVIFQKLADESRIYSWGTSIFDKLAKFTVSLVHLAKISDFRYGVFYDRLLEGVVNDHLLKGRVAMLIGKDYGETPSPVEFVLHCSSFRGSPNSHPYAILLAQMLVAMEKDKLTTMRGAYILNTCWHFYMLEKDGDGVVHIYEYPSMGQGSREDVKTIYRFLKAFRKGEEE